MRGNQDNGIAIDSSRAAIKLIFPLAIRMTSNGVSSEDREFVGRLMELSEITDENLFFAYQFQVQAKAKRVE